MQKIKEKGFFINLIILLLGFFFLVYKIRFSCVYGDDITDFFPYNWNFFHGRIFTELLSVFFVKWFPAALHINIQNFAIISESVLKAVIYCILVYIVSLSYNKFKNNKIIFPLALIASFFIIFAILIQNNFTAHSIKMDEYYQGYITAVIFYLLLWYQIKNISVDDNFCEKKQNVLILLICGLLNLTSNTELTVASIILIMFVLIENLILYIKSKNEIFIKKVRILLILFCLMLFGMLLLWKNPFAITMVFAEHDIKFNFFPEITTVFNFAEMFFKNVIVYNIWFIVILLINLVLILTNKNADKRQITLIIYSLIGFFIFQIATMFCNVNCYCTEEKYKFWFLHGGLISDFSICLYFFTLYLFGYIYNSLEYKRFINNALIIISLFIISLYSYNIFTNYCDRLCFSTNSERRDMYIADKISVYYLKNNKDIIFPLNIDFQLDVIWGYEIEFSNNDKMTICNQDKEKNPYLNYLNYVYSIKLPECVTFRLNDDALRIYRDNGGILTDEELEKLDFRNIEKQFD
jgi:hypothetical protein